MLSGAVCFCLYVCSHTVEINLPSGLSLWNKERRKLARSDTLREKWRKTRQAQGGRIEFRRSAGGVWEIYFAPPAATSPNTPAIIRKIGLPIPSSTLACRLCMLVRNCCTNREASFFNPMFASTSHRKVEENQDVTVDEKITKPSPELEGCSIRSVCLG